MKTQKKELRARYRALRRALSPEERAARDEAICCAATGLVSFRHADVVLLYAPTDGEIDVMPVAAAAMERGKRVAFPRCNTEQHTVKFHIISDLSDLSPGAYGIREPDPRLPVYDPAAKESGVCFIPGLVYDASGYRLGYGGGYYDRFLSAFHGGKVGVIYSDFILPVLTRGYFDARVDILLTEKNVRVPK